MIGIPVHTLLDEFMAAHARGEHPDVGAYLARAAGGREELGELIDRYLQAAAIVPSDEETIVLLQAQIDHVTPLTAARVRRGLRVDDLVEGLLGGLGLQKKSLARLRDAYQDLEREQLDPSRVDERVWGTLRQLLGVDVRRIALRGAGLHAAPAYLRASQMQHPAEALEDEPLKTDKEPDDVNRLFGTS